MIKYSIGFKGYTILNSLIILILLFANFIPTIASSNFDQDQLDQEQIVGNIYEDIYDVNQVVQTFKPTLTSLTRIELFLKRYGDLSGNLTLILLDNLMGYPITQVTKTANDIDIYQKEWIEFDINDTEVETEKTYYIKLKLENGDEFNYIRWYGSELDYYPRGYKLVSGNNGSTWMQYETSDCCFKTYGVNFYDFEIEYLNGGSGAKINFGVKNTGVAKIKNIYAKLEINALITLTGNTYTKVINASLEPGDMLSNVFYPVIGLGPATIKLTVELDDSTYNEVEKDGFLFLFYNYIKP